MSNFASKLTDRGLLQLLAAATVCYWLGLTVVMHIPLAPHLPEPETFLPSDKTVHFVLYAGFAAALFFTLEQGARSRSTSTPRTRLVRAALLFGFCALHGYIEELTQPLTGRTYDLFDLAADCIGAAIALAVCLLVARFMSSRAA